MSHYGHKGHKRISLYAIVEYLICRSVNEREMKDFKAKKMENLTKMTSQTWPFERIRDKTKFGIVKEHFSFGFESLGLRMREEENSW